MSERVTLTLSMTENPYMIYASAVYLEIITSSLQLIKSRPLVENEIQSLTALPRITAEKERFLEEWYQMTVSEKEGLPFMAAEAMNRFFRRSEFIAYHQALSAFVKKFVAACLKLKETDLSPPTRAAQFSEFRRLLHQYALPGASFQEDEPLMDGSITVNDVEHLLFAVSGPSAHVKLLQGATIQHLLMLCEFFEWRFVHHDDPHLLRFKEAMRNYSHWCLAFATFFIIWDRTNQELRVENVLEMTEEVSRKWVADFPGLPE